MLKTAGQTGLKCANPKLNPIFDGRDGLTICAFRKKSAQKKSNKAILTANSRGALIRSLTVYATCKKNNNWGIRVGWQQCNLLDAGCRKIPKKKKKSRPTSKAITRQSSMAGSSGWVYPVYRPTSLDVTMASRKRKEKGGWEKFKEKRAESLETDAAHRAFWLQCNCQQQQ